MSGELCRNCALYDAAKAQDAAGRFRNQWSARCLWVSSEVYPLSIGRHQTRPSPHYMQPNDGEGCPCFTPKATP